MFAKLSAGAAMGLLCLAGTAAVAQTAPPADPAPTVAPVPAAPARAANVVPKNTPIVVEFPSLVTTRTAVRDEMFDLKLSEPVTLNGAVVMPAGTAGKGQVVDVGKPGMGGKPGKLVLAARYLELDGRKIPIKALTVNMTARDQGGQAVAVGVAVGIVGLAVQGGHMEVAAGTKATAKLAADFDPAAPAAPPAAAPQDGAPSTAQPITGTSAAPAQTPQTNP